MPNFSVDGLGEKVSSSIQVNKVLCILSTLNVNFAMQLAVKGWRAVNKMFSCTGR